MPPSYRAQLPPAISVEEMYTAYLESDASLMNLVQGGIYPYTSLNNEGITRDSTPEAFDSDGYLLPIIILKARAPIPDTRVADIREKLLGFSQVVELWIYQDMAYTIIEQILTKVFDLLHGHTFPNCWATQWVYTTGPLTDDAGLSGSKYIRTDFLYRKLRQAIPI